MIGVDISKRLAHFNLEVSFQHEKGILGILGESGCGKSMTLKCIAGLQLPDAGQIKINDRLVYQKDKICLPPQKRRVGYLFQQYALFPNMTVEENIMMGFSGSSLSWAEKKEKTASFLNAFRIKELARRYPNYLSGGQQQRVALARVIASSPDILLLDEPFAALDSQLKENLRLEMKSMIQDYQMQGILVSHDRDDIYQMCSHVMIMQEGKILEYGKTKELFRRVRYKESAMLSGCKNIVPIKKSGEYQVYVPAWQVHLQVTERVGENISYIGIRANDFSVCEGGNQILLVSPRVEELPFSWQIIGANQLWWKKPKINELGCSLPKSLHIDPSQIMLLEEYV